MSKLEDIGFYTLCDGNHVKEFEVSFTHSLFEGITSLDDVKL